MIVRSTAHPALHFLWRHSVHRFAGTEAALDFLGQFKNDAAVMAEFRSLLAARNAVSNSSRLTDDGVLAEMARLIAAGVLLVAEDWKRKLAAAPGAPATAPAGAATPPPPATRTAEPEGPTFLSDHDGTTQAAALRAAAESGVPFCEECARAAAGGEPDGGR